MSDRSTGRGPLVLSALLALVAPAAGAVGFTALVDPLVMESQIDGLSSDGRYRAGSVLIDHDGLAARWSEEDGLTTYFGLPHPGFVDPFDAGAVAVSDDNSTLVGWSDQTGHSRAVQWSLAGEPIPLPTLAGATDPMTHAYALTADGEIAVGVADREAVRWIGTDFVEAISDLHDGWDARALDVTPDGAHIIGVLEYAPDDTEIFRWTAAGGLVPLGKFPGSTRNFGLAVSNDGAVILGESHVPVPDEDPFVEPFIWTASSGMERLGPIPGDAAGVYATSMSGDGRRVIGDISRPTPPGSYPFLWDRHGGFRDLNTALPDEFGIDLGDWFLNRVETISDDGTTIGGFANSPTHGPQAFVVVIPAPEPDPLAMLAVGGVLLLWRARGAQSASRPTQTARPSARRGRARTA